LLSDFLELYRSWAEATQKDLDTLIEAIVALGRFEPTRQETQELFYDVFHEKSPLNSRRRLMLQEAIIQMSMVKPEEDSESVSSIYLNGRGTSIRMPHFRAAHNG
jgi:hypothetical protein